MGASAGMDVRFVASSNATHGFSVKPCRQVSESRDAIHARQPGPIPPACRLFGVLVARNPTAAPSGSVASKAPVCRGTLAIGVSWKQTLAGGCLWPTSDFAVAAKYCANRRDRCPTAVRSISDGGRGTSRSTNLNAGLDGHARQATSFAWRANSRTLAAKGSSRSGAQPTRGRGIAWDAARYESYAAITPT